MRVRVRLRVKMRLRVAICTESDMSRLLLHCGQVGGPSALPSSTAELATLCAVSSKQRWQSAAPQQNSRCRSVFLHVSCGSSVAQLAQQPGSASAAAAAGVAAFTDGASFAAPLIGVLLAGSGAALGSVLLFLRDRCRKRTAKTNATSKTAKPAKPDSGSGDGCANSEAAASAGSSASSPPSLMSGSAPVVTSAMSPASPAVGRFGKSGLEAKGK